MLSAAVVIGALKIYYLTCSMQGRKEINFAKGGKFIPLQNQLSSFPNSEITNILFSSLECMSTVLKINR